jgi:iron complex outermembrane receptor protein
MNLPSHFASCGSKALFRVLIPLLTLALATPLAAADSASAAPGVIVGNVISRATNNGLIGAKVEIPALNVTTFVDSTGRYRLSAAPGTHDLVVTYTGLDSQTVPVVVSAGQTATRDFVLSSSVLVLEAFKVASAREGLSSAMTQQRNADNLKNVASMDQLGDMPNMNATELAIRLPGVTFANPGDEVVEVISVRGMGAGMTSITIDGGGMSSFSAQNRNTRMTAFTGNMFESLELTKGQTPDRSVDSLGGGVNFKTRSPLNQSERRRITYSFTARQAPTFSEQVPLRAARRTHALFNGSYIEKFAIFGSESPNLAVSVNAFYSENAFGFFRTNRDYQQINTQPAFLWDYRTQDNYNNRKQRSLSTKWDYRLGRDSLLKLNLIYNDAPEPMRRQYQTRAFAGSQTTVPNATNTGVVPGWTNRITTVRAVQIPSTSTNTSATTQPALIDVTSNLINRDQRLRHADLAGEHKFNRFDLDWNAVLSRTRYRFLGSEGNLINRIGNIPFIGPNGGPGSATNNIVGPNGETGVGWILDRTQSDLYPRFIQNGGLDFTNPNNYRPAVNGLSTQSGNLDIDLLREARANVKYLVPIESFTLFLKTGASIRDRSIELERRNRRWSYLGTTALPTDPSILLWDTLKTGRKIPQWEGAQFIQNGRPTNPALWQEDVYFYENNRRTASNKVGEVITGYYVMTQGKIGNNGFLAGIRREVTDTTGESARRVRVLSTAAQQLADPVGSAIRDSVPYKNEGSYGQNFPSVHLWRDLTPNVKARAAWTTGFGRPTLANNVTALSFSDPNQTVTFGNPDLKPTRAYNWDFSVETYFSNSSSFTVGWFHKKLEDLIVSNFEIGTVGSGADNGFDGEFSGYSIRSSANAGTAFTQGWEFSYIQNFRFLPGALKGLTLNANLSQITAHGDYGTPGAYIKDKDVNGFIPLTMNVYLSWNYKKFGASASYNYTGENIRNAYNLAQPSRNQYLQSREIVNANLRYSLRPGLTLTFGVQNLFNEPQIYYRSVRDQLETFLVNGTTITGGVEGRF